MTAFEGNWRKLVTLISQQHDVVKYKETIYESFNLYPTSRPALLDLFSDIIVDKYLHSYVHQRGIHTNELEEVIAVLLKEINSILDKEFDCPDYVTTALKSKASHYSGYGFNNYVCQWVLIVLLKITVKYEQILSIKDEVLSNDKVSWNQVPVIMDLLDILCKTINSKMVGHEVVSIIMRHVAQHRNHLLWVVKYIGERHPSGIVDKVIDCILSEFIPQHEYSKLQSCMLVLSNLGAHHARQLQSALYDKLKKAIDESSHIVTQHKFTNYQTLIYFTLLLASRSDFVELTSASLAMFSRIIAQFNPKQLEQFFLNQNFSENILRSYYHMTLNIMLNSLDLEIGHVLEFLVQHSHTAATTKSAVTCCSAPFSQMCINIVDNVCAKLLIQSHCSSISKVKSGNRTMSLAVLNSVNQRIDFWMDRVVKDGSSVAAKLLCCVILNDFKTVGEDVLVAILCHEPSSSPQEVAGHMAAMVLFFYVLDECELVHSDVLDQVIVRSLCVAQSFKAAHRRRFLCTLYSMLVYEARMQSQRRRLARTISANVDLLLLLAIINKSLPIVRLTVAILQKVDVISDESFSTPTTSPFCAPATDLRFKAWPIFLSARITRSISVMFTALIDGLNDPSTCSVATIRQLTDFLVNHLRCTDARHTSASVQVIFREYLRSSMIETNNRSVFKKTLKPGWFGTKLVHDTPPVANNVGQLQIARKLALSPNKFDRIQEMYWGNLLMTLCHFHRCFEPGSTSACQVIHWVIRQTLYPSYYLPVNPDVKVILKDLNSITTSLFSLASNVIQLWRRFNSVDIFWSLFNFLAHKSPDTLESSYQTLKALMIACEHLWSTSDCPKRRLIRNVMDSDIFVTETQDKTIHNEQKYYELINTNSALYRATVSLLESLSHKMPLTEELKLMLPYLSSTEVRTVLTHLAFNWNKQSLQKPSSAQSQIVVPKEQQQHNPSMEQDNEDVTMIEPVEEVQVKNTFSWDTLLPAIVHSRIHFKSLYDQFYRLLFVPYDY